MYWEKIKWTVKLWTNCFKVGCTESSFGTWSSYVVHVGSVDMACIVVTERDGILYVSVHSVFELIRKIIDQL